MNSYIPQRMIRAVLGIAIMLVTFSTLALQAEDAALADAIEAKDAARIAELMKADVDINAVQVDGMTALLWATYYDDWKLGGQLLKRGADATAENNYGIHPLHLACLNGNPGFVRALLDAGANPNASVYDGETALLTAARTGDAESVRLLIVAGANVDAKERNGQTAAMWAAAAGHKEVVQVLIDAGADFDTPLKRSGFTPFFFAVREGQTGVVRLLLANGADVNLVMHPENSGGKRPRKGTSPLILAIENGHYDLAMELLDAGADANDERSGFTPLHTLTWIRKPDIGESADGDPEPQGSGRRNSFQFIRELVAGGADVNARLSRGRKAGGARVGTRGATPFFLAADRADLEYMKLLVELGADPMIPNEDGTTPLMVAAGIGSSAPEEEAGNEAECLAAVKYLVSLGADVNTVDENGETAMHGAAYKNIPAVVYYLDEQGADINLWNTKNDLNRTPLLIAEGYRPGNFKPSFETVEAITEVMLANGVKPPTGPKPKHTNYAD